MPLDILGAEIEVGDTIAIACKSNYISYMKIGVVKTITASKNITVRTLISGETISSSSTVINTDKKVVIISKGTEDDETV